MMAISFLRMAPKVIVYEDLASAYVLVDVIG